jgi:aconitate hydratase
MVRGTFANVRLKNEMVDREGGWTIYHPTGEVTTVYDAAIKYQGDNIPLIIIAGREYGSGSSRDWAAKGVALLGVRAIIAGSFERIHRSNLIGTGILPLQFKEGDNAESLELKGDETFSISALNGIKSGQQIRVNAVRASGEAFSFDVIARLDSDIEVAYYRNGGILQYVLRNFIKTGNSAVR